jgi:hypothetical protein
MMTNAVAEPSIAADRPETPTRISIIVAPAATDGAMRRVAEPVTFGLPFPRGLSRDADGLQLRDDRGYAVPLQARALDRWPDGSIRWALVDFQADLHRRHRRYEVVVGETRSTKGAGPGIAITSTARAVAIDTGAARFSFAPHAPFPFTAVIAGGRPALDASRTGLRVEDASGELMTPSIESIQIEEQGPLRASVVCRGWLQGTRATPRLELIARFHFFAGSPTVRVALTIRNPQPASHPGGHWTLGSGGSILLRDVSLRFALPAADGITSIRCSPEHGVDDQICEAPLELLQESSGGEARPDGYRLRAGRSDRRGRRACPVVWVSNERRTIAVAMQHFWQNFPKAIAATRDEVTVGLFPPQEGVAHEIQGGEQKTHTFHVAFGRDRVTSDLLDWCRTPLVARAEPSWYCSSGVVPYLVPVDADRDCAYIALGQSAVDGADTFARKRELVDEYGWRNFGDLYADHEAVFHNGALPLVSHYNNQYDAIAGFGWRFLRSGDPRWWTLMCELAAHVVDIDVYHTDGDKSAYNHALFWHTYHYVDAGTSTHRSYPNDPKVGGGGPSAEHNYPAGLLLHYFLTGDPLSRETAIELAQWVIDMDEGRRSIFRWVDRGATGLASMTGSPLYHGPGRGAANSIVALLTGHRATGDARFLRKAEELIRRCIHPRDDVAERNLLDAERRWFYTVFLQALGKYLDYKIELQSLDAMYAYARASLLHYADWMVDYEYPYLDRPQILEYPTETWAAQDMRKSDVFAFAAKQAAGAARDRFLERADFFFHTSVSKLAGMPTRTLTRPVVLMLTNGLMHAGCPRSAAAPAGPRMDADDFGVPVQFVPQKTRALDRASRLAAVTSLVAIAAVIFYLFG